MNVSDGVGGGMSQSTSADTGRGKGGLGALTATPGGGGSATTGRGPRQPPPPVPGSAVSNQSTFAPHSNAAYTAGSAGGENHSDDDGEAEYAQVQEYYPGHDVGLGMGGVDPQMYTFSQDTTPNKGGKVRSGRIRGPMDKGQTLGGSKWMLIVY